MQHPVENKMHRGKLTPLNTWSFYPYPPFMIDGS
jgi:hypothetical protein